MSEKERMLAGELYRYEGDAELFALGQRCRRLTLAYNATHEDEEERRGELLAELFGAVGGHAHRAAASLRLRCVHTRGRALLRQLRLRAA